MGLDPRLDFRAALRGSRALAPLLYGVEARDATSIAGGVVLLTLATLIPARTAAAVDPDVTLRQD